MAAGIAQKGGNVNELALFAGAGGGILGGKLLGWRTICAVEINAYRRSIGAANLKLPSSSFSPIQIFVPPK